MRQPLRTLCTLAALLYATSCNTPHTPDTSDPDEPSTENPAERTVGLMSLKEGVMDGYTIFSSRNHSTTFLINNRGEVINMWEGEHRVENSRLLDDGSIVRVINIENGNYTRNAGSTGRIERLSWEGELLWRYDYCDNTHTFHHDFVPVKHDDGTYTFLMIAWEYMSQVDAIANGRNPKTIGSSQRLPDGSTSSEDAFYDTFLLNEQIVELKPTTKNDAEIIWSWHSADHLIQDFDDTKLNYGSVEENPQLLDFNYTYYPSDENAPTDWMHANGIDYNSALDQIVITFLMSNELYIIDHSTTTEQAAGHSGGRYGKGGDFLYRWGCPAAYRAGTAADIIFSGVHTPHWIAEGYEDGGSIMVLSNGRALSASTIEVFTPQSLSEGVYVEPQLGETFLPKTSHWRYINSGNFFTRNMGSVARLKNGNTLACEAFKGRFIEIAPDGEIVWEYINPVGKNGAHSYNTPLHKEDGTAINLANQTFKIYKYPTSHPAFTGKELEPKGVIETMD